MKAYTSVAFNHPVCGHSLQQPQETNADNVSEWAAPGNVCSKELAESGRGGLSGSPGNSGKEGRRWRWGIRGGCESGHQGASRGQERENFTVRCEPI